MPEDARDFARAVRVTAATSVVLFAAWCALDVAAILLPLGAVAQLAFTIACYVTPFAVIALHLRLQRPRYSSIGGAVWTGLTACVLALALILTAGLWLHVQLGGEFC